MGHQASKPLWHATRSRFKRNMSREPRTENRESRMRRERERFASRKDSSPKTRCLERLENDRKGTGFAAGKGGEGEKKGTDGAPRPSREKAARGRTAVYPDSRHTSLRQCQVSRLPERARDRVSTCRSLGSVESPPRR